MIPRSFTVPTIWIRFLSLVFSTLLVFNVIARYTYGFPLLIEGFLQIVFSEVNHRKQRSRFERFKQQSADVERLGEKASNPTQCVGGVIGYREDPVVFRKCLESYRDDSGKSLRALIVGIDGNEAEDFQMIRMAESVFGKDTPTIELKEPLGALATRTIQDWRGRQADILQKDGTKARELHEDELNDLVMDVLIRHATGILEEHGLLYQDGAGGMRAICVCQPHQSKKEIMFTCMVFLLALCRANGVDFVWSSDSDSWIHPGAIHRVVGAMASDAAIGGSCGGLRVHNHGASVVARLVAATYWTDLALTSGQNSAFDVTDCQPGPCAAFRAHALREILAPWYTQTFLGVRPVVNEDRHLTTRLLLRGYKVTFNPHAPVATDSPATFATWILQQVRWSRAIVLETLAHPRMFVARNPMLSLYALRRIAGPFFQAWIMLNYLLAGRSSRITSPIDIAARILLCSLYTLLRHRRCSLRTYPFLCLSQVFLQLPQPPIVFWACATFLDGSWGTAMRSSGEKEKVAQSPFRKNAGPYMAVAIWVGLVGATVCKYVVSISFVGDEKVCAAFGFFAALANVLYVLISGH